MSGVTQSQSKYWARHFTKLATERHKPRGRQLDFANATVATQTYAFILEACGQLGGKHVLDCGFGTGELARVCDLMGGAVDAIDIVNTRIPTLRDQAPTIYWSRGDVATWTLPQNSDAYDVIIACEVLQYVDFDRAIRNLLSALTENGRLVVMVPNADCPIVKRSALRFENYYVGISPRSFRDRFAQYTRSFQISHRGIRFRKDQTLGPYRSDPWVQLYDDRPPVVGEADRRSGAPVPNRVQIVFAR